MDAEQKSQKIYYSKDVLDMKRKIEVLGNHGAYKDAKLIKRHLKN